MNVGIAQINTTVGAIENNTEKILEVYHRLQSQCDLILLPELSLCGYPPRDLLLRRSFLEQAKKAIDDIAQQTLDAALLVGFPESTSDGKLYNALAFCHQGKVKRTARKTLLPSYDVFDEDRYFSPASEVTVLSFCGYRIGITICEDLWNQGSNHPCTRYDRNPVTEISAHSLDILLNAAASPWHVGKNRERLALLQEAAGTCGCPVVYVNAIGGNDELIFDGGSTVVNASGKMVWEAPSFVEAFHCCDTGSKKIEINSPMPELLQIESALVLGLRDYARKSGFSKIVLGLSGGIDSALTAYLAVQALGKENVQGISLPSAISSQHSKEDAQSLAKNLGIRFSTIPINGIFSEFRKSLNPLFSKLPEDVTEENLQSRSRGVILMAIANKTGALLLTTGNKSELAVGYCTLYGDLCGGLAVIADLPKTTVFALSKFINREREIIPWNTRKKPPSAELKPGQEDLDSLPPYEDLDAILKAYVEKNQSLEEITALGYSTEVVEEILKKVDRNDHKRNQAPPVLKISPLAFGVGRRFPIVKQ